MSRGEVKWAKASVVSVVCECTYDEEVEGKERIYRCYAAFGYSQK